MPISENTSRLKTTSLIDVLEQLVDNWRDEDCKHTWAKMYQEREEPAELICAEELSAVVVAIRLGLLKLPDANRD